MVEKPYITAVSRVSVRGLVYISSIGEGWNGDEKGLILGLNHQTRSVPGFPHTTHTPHIVFYTLVLLFIFNMRYLTQHQRYTKCLTS